VEQFKIYKIRILLTFFFVFLYCQNSKAQTVYVTPYGTHYHKGNCKTVVNVSNEMDLLVAVKKGYKPCRICNPPTVRTPLDFSSNIPRGVKTTTQCKGITKAGKRCKHKTTIANGYCFQHNPDRVKKN
jgi:hypothetical protein